MWEFGAGFGIGFGKTKDRLFPYLSGSGSGSGVLSGISKPNPINGGVVWCGSAHNVAETVSCRFLVPLPVGNFCFYREIQGFQSK